MACTARPTENGITINYVFTPMEHRKKGYASMLVADLCKEMLSKYRFVTLFADSYNASTNKIYRAIGFKEIGDFSEVYFQNDLLDLCHQISFPSKIPYRALFARWIFFVSVSG